MFEEDLLLMFSDGDVVCDMIYSHFKICMKCRVISDLRFEKLERAAESSYGLPDSGSFAKVVDLKGILRDGFYIDVLSN